MLAEPIVYGFLVAALLMGAGWMPWRRGAPPRHAQLSSALAVVLAYLAAHYGVRGVPRFPPVEAADWLVFLVLASVLFVPLAGAQGERRALPLLAEVPAWGGFLWFALEPLRQHHWPGGAGALRLAGLFVLGLALLSLTRRLAHDRGRGPGLSLVYLVTASATGAAVGQSWGGTAHIAVALSSVPGVAAVLSLWRPEREPGRGMAEPLTVALGGILLVAVLFSDTPWYAALLLVLAPQVGWIRLGRLGDGLVAGLVRAVLAAGLGALAVWLCLGDPDPYGGY